jgi:hypothetical protein
LTPADGSGFLHRTRDEMRAFRVRSRVGLAPRAYLRARRAALVDDALCNRIAHVAQRKTSRRNFRAHGTSSRGHADCFCPRVIHELIHDVIHARYVGTDRFQRSANASRVIERARNFPSARTIFLVVSQVITVDA